MGGKCVEKVVDMIDILLVALEIAEDAIQGTIL